MPSPPMPPSYDPFTALQAAGHDRAALARLAEEEQPGLTAWLERVLRDDDLAQEAVQETWLVLSRGDWSFAARTEDAAGDVRAWLRRIALRAALRLRERQRTQRRHLDGWFRLRAAPIVVPTPLEQLAEQDRRDLVWAMVAELPATLREPLELRFREGFDFAAIGRAQGCTALTARVRTWRGLERMRRRLQVLGIMVMPTSLMATLAGGNAGIGGITGALTVGVLPRMLAHMKGTGGAPVVSVVLVGGMVTSALCWWLLAPGVVDIERTTPASVLSNEDAAAIAARPAWELRRPLTDDWTVAGGIEEKKNPTPAGALRAQVLIDTRVFVPSAPVLPFSTTRPTVLTAEQRDQLLARLATQGDEMLTKPRLLMGSGTSAVVQLIDQTAYIAGYERAAVGPQPVTSLVNGGFYARISSLIEADGIRIIEAPAQITEQRGIIQRSARVPTPTGTFQDLPWDEPTVHFSRAVALPRDGILIPPGGSLLLPASEGRLDHATPGGITSTPDAAFPGWWMLIMPFAVEAESEGEPTPPSARS